MKPNTRTLSTVVGIPFGNIVASFPANRPKLSGNCTVRLVNGVSVEYRGTR